VSQFDKYRKYLEDSGGLSRGVSPSHYLGTTGGGGLSKYITPRPPSSVLYGPTLVESITEQLNTLTDEELTIVGEEVLRLLEGNDG
jgi:hypothetical protein